MLKHKSTLLLLCLFAGTAVLGEEHVPECTRYDPQEIKATFFDPSFSSTLNLYLDAVTEFENAIQDLKDKFPKMAEKSNSEQAAQFFANFKEEIGICLRAHVRHWSKITETQLDILDKSRSPSAPKTLSDLKEAIDDLSKMYRQSAETLNSALEDALKDGSVVFKPLLVVIEQLIKAGGEKVGMNYLEKTIDNTLGQMLLSLVQIRLDSAQDLNVGLFEDLILKSEALAQDFTQNGRKLTIQEFWKSTLNKMGKIGEVKDFEPKDKIRLVASTMHKLMDIEDTPDLVDVLKGLAAARN